MSSAPIQIRGRGAAENPPNRFERIEVVANMDAYDPDDVGPRTVFLRDPAKTLIVKNDSPDVSFDYGINPYRGCEHGCAYCFARPTHEYLGFSAGLDSPVLGLRTGGNLSFKPAPEGVPVPGLGGV